MTTILTVEDDERFRRLLLAVLTPEYEVIQAVNATEAIELARLNQPDLVLLDFNLKGDLDGVDVCQTLRSEADPALAQVPIVMLTGRTGQADIRAALEAGANSYIGKPYSPTALLSLVDTLLAREGVYQ